MLLYFGLICSTRCTNLLTFFAKNGNVHTDPPNFYHHTIFVNFHRCLSQSVVLSSQKKEPCLCLPTLLLAGKVKKISNGLAQRHHSIGLHLIRALQLLIHQRAGFVYLRPPKAIPRVQWFARYQQPGLEWIRANLAWKTMLL